MERASTGPQDTATRLAIWWDAARPKTLWAAAAPVLMGTAMAYTAGGWHGWSALCALLGAMWIQVGTNYANDYYDFLKGADAGPRLGPVRATQAGLVPPEAMKRATSIAFALALVPGAYLVYRGGWPLVAIGLVSILCGLLYTAGPWPLGYIGAADLFVLVFFGPVAVGGTYYVQTLSMDWRPLVAGLAPGLLSVALLTVNNLRDIDTDRAAGKKTLAVRFGGGFARAEYVVCLVIAGVGVPVVLAATSPGRWTVLIALLAVVPAVPALRTVLAGTEGAALNCALARTGKLLLLFGILFSLGWMA